MTTPPDRDDSSLPVDALERVNCVCRDFEAAWLRGERPQIETCLGGTEGQERSLLVRELVLLELDYRQRTGEQPRLEEYAARFPDERDLLGELAQRRSPPASAKGKVVRFCVLCGQEIGDKPFCVTPTCDGLPNYYRYVPGPGVERPGRKGRKRVPGRPAAVGDSVPVGRTVPLAEGEEDRFTVPIQASAIAVLRRTQPPHSEHELYPGSNEVGARAPARLIIDEPEISSLHARIDCSPDAVGTWRLSVVDQGSTNGCFVNGERVERKELREGDRVRFATIEYEVRFLAAEDPRVTVAL